MENFGERLLTEEFNVCSIEHLHRYAFALQFIDNKIVVDIASGEGYGAYLLSSKANTIIGVDIDIEAVEHSKKKYLKNNLSYLHGSATEIPVETGIIDVVISFETIEHHDKHQEMMNEIKRILKPDGVLIISSPDKLYYSDAPNFKNEFHVKELYFEEFKSLIQENFSNSVFLNQKVNLASLLIQNECNSFYEFSGDFNAIEKHEGIQNPVYNIAIASQNKIENVFSSSFNGDLIYQQLRTLYDKVENKTKIINEILNSKTYRFGNFFIKPFRFIKRFFNA